MPITPINMAEAIIDPFWDSQLSGLSRWQIAPGAEHGLRVSQNWCWVAFEWARRPPAGPALRMTRQYGIELAGYDSLLVSVMAPEGTVFRMIAVTDAGTFRYQAPPAGKQKVEHALELHGAGRLDSLTLEIDAADDEVAAGWLNWVGLRRSEFLAPYQAQWRRFDAAWEPYLQPEDFAPTFTPRYGLLMDGEELAAFRAQHEAFLGAHGHSPFLAAAEMARRYVPEQMVGDFVNFWGDTRYCRERDHGMLLLGDGAPGFGVRAAIAGLLLRDAELLRLGARYAMALGMCTHWDDGMICDCPGSSFEHRCFVQSLVVQELALILDLAGEYFTDIGRDYLLRRIAEEGLGAINFNTWKHEYIFHCNQLAWFSPGRMLGCLLLERHWPRVKPYTELAYADLIESLGYAILPDGGYTEGPTYFTCVGRNGGFSLYLYARARGLAFAEVIPEPMRRTAAFAAALASTDEEQDVIPICDAHYRLDTETLAVMASLLPDSQWVSMYQKAVARLGGLPNTLFTAQLAPRIPPAAPVPPAFTFLPDMGIMASVRQLAGETVKLFIMGNQANAGHTHEDKGSFVLEFAGDTFALDPGTCDYSSPLAVILQNCERHNMLVPSGTPARPHPACPLPHDVKPRGAGDEHAFTAAIDATPVWEGYFRRWERRWDSPTPATLRIHDCWELAAGNAVESYWQTHLPVQVHGQTVTLTGKRGQAIITAPDMCLIRVDTLPLLQGAQTRLAFRMEQPAGEMVLTVELKVI